MDVDAFIAGLPKAELHMHIEGSLEPELMFELARRNGVAIPYADVEAVRAAYSFSRLQDFLDIYYQGAAVLRTEADFRDLAMAYFDRAAADNVRHAEIFFDPQTHTARGVPFGVVAEGLLTGMAEAWLDRIAAVGLDSSELGHPPADFARVFAAAAAQGLKRVAHAGEEGPPAYVAQALDLLHIDRLDHGNRSLEDPALTTRLAREAMTLTVCPLSNLRLCVVASADAHPIARMLRLGLRATINSDDPAYFCGYINDNYRAVADQLSREDLVTLARNSFLGSFLPDADVARHVAAIEKFATNSLPP
jgi:adenosine deaminase